MSFVSRKRLLLLFAIGASLVATEVPHAAASSLYADPSWAYLFEGGQAYYHDPDGPNPDYINGSATNQPGGQGNTPALDQQWIINGSQWDGSAPGDPLGGAPGSPPPIPPAAPGGVETYTTDGTSFLRIQDAGQPQSWGWADKGAQASPSSPRQEGNNRRIQFAHKIAEDDGYSGNGAVLDLGITISLRARLSTTATGPLDLFYSEDGPSTTTPQPWPTDGKGYAVANNGRGMFSVTQNGTAGPGQLAFSLLDQNTIDDEGLGFSKTGLVFNNKSGGPNTNDATEATLNIVEVENSELTQWQEFWITVRALAVPLDGSTHEVNVYHNGSLEPLTYTTVLGNQNEFGTGPHLGLGLSSGTRWGAFDVDFFAYKEGIIVPTLADVGRPGDFNEDGDVDGRDFLVWQRGQSPSPLSSTDLLAWQQNYGAQGLSAVATAIPEPASLVFGLGCLGLFFCRRSKIPLPVPREGLGGG
jgi:hypothetical protein